MVAYAEEGSLGPYNICGGNQTLPHRSARYRPGYLRWEAWRSSFSLLPAISSSGPGIPMRHEAARPDRRKPRNWLRPPSCGSGSRNPAPEQAWEIPQTPRPQHRRLQSPFCLLRYRCPFPPVRRFTQAAIRAVTLAGTQAVVILEAVTLEAVTLAVIPGQAGASAFRAAGGAGINNRPKA